MLQPKDLEEARAAYDTYSRLKGDVPRPPKAEVVQPEAGESSTISKAEFATVIADLQKLQVAVQGLHVSIRQGQRQGPGQTRTDTRPKETRSVG